MAARISPQQARQDMQSAGALLVCAYDSADKFEHNHLEGAMALSSFRAQESSLPRDKEVIFYCA